MREHHYRNSRYVDVGVGRKIGYYYYHMWILWSCCCCYYCLIGCKLVVVDGRPISLSEQGWKVRHGGPPPITTTSSSSSRTRESNKMGNKEEDRELEEDGDEKVKLQPLRVLFDTTELDVDTWNRQPQLRDTINYLKEEVLPNMQTLLQETLSIVQRGKDIIDDSPSDVAWRFRLPEDTCYDLLQNVDFTYNEKDPSSGYIVDMEKHDMVMFVLSNSFNNEVLKCEETTFAMSAPCLLYQSTDRPLVSIVSLCLNNLVTTLPPSSDPSNNFNNNINDQRLEHTLLHEITHNLGFNSEMYKFYRNPRTGQPLVPRPFIKAQSINCVQKRTLKDIELPTNVIEPLFHSTTTNQLKSFHMITPTVQQIVRTQFNCPHVANIAGLLENQPTNSDDCFGSHWDERYHLYNSMSSLYDQEAYFTPLTLALLEDTGWYRPNYNHPQIQISPFGLHAGCSFLTDTCVTSEGTLPSYANGYFCNQPYNTNNDNNWLCDANHSARGKCDLFPSRKSPMSNNFGPFYTSADHCPLVRMDLIDCQKPSNQIYNQHYKYNNIIPNELFGPSSSCIQTNTIPTNSQSLTTTTTTTTTAICTTTLCNTKQKTVDITIDGTTVSCQTDFQQITIPSNTNNGYTHTITCPRISSICPQMVTCPSQCSGKGTCDFNTLKCNCFDTTDTTEGCYNSLPLPYPNNNNNNSDNNQLSDAWQSLMNMPPYPNQKKKSSSHTPHPAKTIMTIIITMTILLITIFF